MPHSSHIRVDDLDLSEQYVDAYQGALRAITASIDTINDCIAHSKRCVRESREALAREEKRASHWTA